MKSVIGALRVNLGLDSAKFQKGLSESQKRLRDFGKQFRRVASVAAAAGAAISAAALKGAQDIDQAAKAARRLDASIGAFEALKLAASEAGVSVSSLPNEIQNINRELANIGTSGNADRALERLGLSLDDLTGLDADEKLATISDAVKALGLSSGEATAVLRDLGVRNREVALLMIQGGDAIRRARRDVEDYGLALDGVEAGRIEAANDSIARLGLITRYAGQQLALELVPAMGRLADAMTDSLREGGALRAVIDGLANNINRMITYVGTAVAAFGVRYVGALVASRVATLALSGSLAVLRGAMIRTGIGALIVGAGELMYQFTRLITRTGGVGNAFRALGDIAGAVWSFIVDSAAAIPPGLEYVWNSVKAGFLSMIAGLRSAWAGFLSDISGDINLLSVEGDAPWAKWLNDKIGLSVKSPLSGVAEKAKADAEAMQETVATALEGAATSASDASATIANAYGKMTDTVRMARLGLTDLRTEFPKVKKEADDASDATDEFSGSLGGAGAAAGGAAKAGIDKLAKSVQDVSRATEDMGKKFGDLAADVITKTRSMSDVLQQFAKRMLSSGLGNLFNSLTGDPLTQALRGAGLNASGGGILSGLAGLIPGFANGVENFRGGLARINERGGELVNLPGGSTVIPHDLSRRMVESAAQPVGGEVDINIGVHESGNIKPFVERVSGQVAVRVVAQDKRNSSDDQFNSGGA